jgi:hypothetical protein
LNHQQEWVSTALAPVGGAVLSAHSALYRSSISHGLKRLTRFCPAIRGMTGLWHSANARKLMVRQQVGAITRFAFEVASVDALGGIFLWGTMRAAVPSCQTYI